MAVRITEEKARELGWIKDKPAPATPELDPTLLRGGGHRRYRAVLERNRPIMSPAMAMMLLFILGLLIGLFTGLKVGQ